MTTPRKPRPAVTATFVDEPRPGEWPAVPFDVRLRRFLKAALRGYGLRCKAIRPATVGEKTNCVPSVIPSR